VFRGAQIIFNNRNSVIDCAVTNLSETGARLRVASAAGIPEQFQLRYANGEERQCRIQWWWAKHIGVSFEADRLG
jgi:hypothetical protein